jgi:hypothetical protein
MRTDTTSSISTKQSSLSCLLHKHKGTDNVSISTRYHGYRLKRYIRNENTDHDLISTWYHWYRQKKK